MSETTKLKKSLWGFDVAEVMTYLEKLQASYDAEIENKRKENLELSGKLEYVLKKAADLQSQLDVAAAAPPVEDSRSSELEMQLFAAETKIAELTALVAEKEDGQNSEMEAQLFAAEAKVAELMVAMAEKEDQRNGEIEVRLFAAETKVTDLTAVLAEKDAEIQTLQNRSVLEDATSQIGRIFIDAQTNAAAITEQAEIRACEIKATAAQVANKTIDDIDGTQNELNKVREKMEEMIARFTIAMNDINYSLDEARVVVEQIRSAQETPEQNTQETTGQPDHCGCEPL